MAPSFVIDFATLLLFGPHVTMLVALAGALSQELAGDEQPPMPRRLFYNLAAILTATQPAGLAYQTLDGIAKVGWPWQAVHVVAAVAAYAAVKPLGLRSFCLLSVTQAANRQWSERALRAHPTSSWVRACVWTRGAHRTPDVGRAGARRHSAVFRVPRLLRARG